VMGEAEAAAELDVTKTPAFAVLEELFKDGKVTEKQLQRWQSKYVEMHDAVLATYENEKALLGQGRQLKADLLLEKEKLDASGPSGDVEPLDALEEEKKKAVGQASIAEEKETMLKLQIAEYERQREELENDMAQAKREKAAEFEPYVRELEKDLADLTDTIAQQKISIQKMDDEKKESVLRIQGLQEKIKELAVVKLACAAERRKVQSEPDKVAKQAEVVGNAKKTLQRELDKLEDRMHEIDVTASTQVHTQKRIETNSTELDQQLDQQLAMTEDKQRACDEGRKKVAFCQATHEDGLAEQVRLDVEMKSRQRDAKREHENLARRGKEKDAALRRVKKGEQELRLAQDSLPPIERMLEACRTNQIEIKERRKQQDAQLDDLKREHETLMYNFLKHEKVESRETDAWQSLNADVKDLHAELTEMMGTDRELAKEVAQLSAARELSSREASKVLRAFNAAMEELQVKDIYIGDLAKKKAEVGAKCTSYEKLYDLTKNERNKNVNLIQAASQGLAEWKEKIKILQNEVDILSSESISKDVHLAKSRLDHQGEVATRDNNRAEVNKQLVEYRKAREAVEQQLVEIDKLNAIINTIERDMLRLKRHYETAVEDRNYTGIQLIDRNDELCILYEKHNIQEQVLTKGELELQAREEDIRRLNLERVELGREKEVVRKFLPVGPEMESDVVTLKEELEAARRETARLSDILESPENDRWRLLPGGDPTPQELAETIKTFEERLNDKKEALLEKELVLEEVSSLSERLRAQAADGRADTLELAKRVNDFQARIRAMTKKMMATVSELSMYQATAMKLQQEKHELELEVQDAQWRVDQGQPPNEDVELEWERLVREQEYRRAAAEQAQAQAAVVTDAFAPAQITRTTAEPRPNAYIPDDIGIPKPYGALAPFKPSASGRGLSHMRAPTIKPVEI